MSGRAVDPHRALKRLFLAALVPAAATVDHERQVPWSSLTFSGARHFFEMSIVGDNALSAVAKLSDAIRGDQISLTGHVVVDIMLSSYHLIRSFRETAIVLNFEVLTVKAA